MPQISRFFGIIILMYYDDHNPPHFHARYGSQECLIRINDLTVLEGNLPSRALKMVIEWAELHQDELIENWERAAQLQTLGNIDPLN
jgi:Domain of unknown function (DUF4160)